jgi:hypothetical protein
MDAAADGAAATTIEPAEQAGAQDPANPDPNAPALNAIVPSAEPVRGTDAAPIAAEQAAAAAEGATSEINSRLMSHRPPTNFIHPTPGRIVWYRKSRDDGIPESPNDEPLAAQIAGVIDSHTVNIAVLGFDGSGPHPRQNVRLVQDGPCQPGQCTWTPYQKWQAARTEQLEAKVAGQ